VPLQKLYSIYTCSSFGLVIGFIDHLQVLTTSNYNTVADFHFTNHSTLIFSVYFHWSSLSISWQWTNNMETVKVSLNYTLTVLLYYSTCKHMLSLLGTVWFLQLLNPWILICDDFYILLAQTTPRKHSSSIVACMSAGIATWLLPSQSVGTLAAAYQWSWCEPHTCRKHCSCIVGHVFTLATHFTGSIGECFEQIHHSIFNYLYKF
jgi:hypothetical protein